jgi:hypothetical protein
MALIKVLPSVSESQPSDSDSEFDDASSPLRLAAVNGLSLSSPITGFEFSMISPMRTVSEGNDWFRTSWIYSTAVSSAESK